MEQIWVIFTAFLAIRREIWPEIINNKNGYKTKMLREGYDPPISRCLKPERIKTFL